MRPELQKKINQAIRLLKLYNDENNPVEVAYSGGKDSDVILQLAKEAGINYRAIYKNTTIDPPGTIKHCKDMGVEIMQPKKSFFQLIEQNGLPTRFSRFCCRYLKEYKVLDKAIIGVRREESRQRAERYKEPTRCRLYNKNEYVEQIMPILEWTTQDVAEFLQDRKIKCAPVYYDECGNFHPERRLGCLGCPLAGRRTRLETLKKYPNIVRQYCNRQRKYRKEHPQVKAVTKYFNNEYEQVFRDLFCATQQEFVLYQKSLFAMDFKAFLENYFNIKL